MAMEEEAPKAARRYARVRGPFDGNLLGDARTSILIYDLNLGGALVNFGDEQPTDETLRLMIDLPREGPIAVNAETVYRDLTGTAVRFVDVDQDSAARLARTIDALTERSF